MHDVMAILYIILDLEVRNLCCFVVSSLLIFVLQNNVEKLLETTDFTLLATIELIVSSSLFVQLFSLVLSRQQYFRYSNDVYSKPYVE